MLKLKNLLSMINIIIKILNIIKAKINKRSLNNIYFFKVKNSPPLFSIGLLLIAMISIHIGSALAKSLFLIISAESLVTLRQLIGTIILLILFRPWRLQLRHNIKFHLFIYGIAMGGMNYLFYLSLRTLPLGIAVALEFTGPLAISMLLSRKLIDFLWLLMAGGGLYILLSSGQDISSIDLTGSFFALGAGISWGIYIIAGQKAGQIHGPSIVSIGSLIASIIFCPIGIWQSSDSILSFSIFPLALGVAILSTVLPYSLEIIALPKIPVRTFGTLMSLEPALAAITGMLFLHEELSFIQWMALGSIIIASIGAALSTK